MRGLWLLVVALLTGCAAVPEAVREAPPDFPTLSAVRNAPEDYQGERIRWGGVIAEVLNQADVTLIAVVARPLDSAARPREGAASDGRFLARFTTFLDPAIYTVGRDITVTGRLEGTQMRLVGDYRYTYPVVDVSGRKLWPPRREVRAVSPPYGWYSPPGWYSPWWDCHDPWGWRCGW